MEINRSKMDLELVGQRVMEKSTKRKGEICGFFDGPSISIKYDNGQECSAGINSPIVKDLIPIDEDNMASFPLKYNYGHEDIGFIKIDKEVLRRVVAGSRLVLGCMFEQDGVNEPDIKGVSLNDIPVTPLKKESITTDNPKFIKIYKGQPCQEYVNINVNSIHEFQISKENDNVWMSYGEMSNTVFLTNEEFKEVEKLIDVKLIRGK